MESRSWVKVHEYPSRFEAEMAKARLESEGIPVLITSHGQGIFGAGFQGPVLGGVDLHVPAQAVEKARDALDLDDVE